MKLLFKTLILMLLAVAAHAQAEFASVDALARNTRKSNYPTPEALVKFLCKDLKNDREKARVIFTWIATNIRYQELNTPDADSQEAFGDKLATQAYKRGKGVCMHYAYLYKKMAEAVGLECAFVSGFSRKDLRASGGDHAWNAVKINGKWELLDVTWGASYREKNGDFNQVFRPGYFCTAPRIFVLNHIPEDEKWQLMEPPLSKKQLEQLPVFSYGDLAHDIQDAEPFGGSPSKKPDGTMVLKIKIQNPPPVIRLENHDREIKSTRIDEAGWVILQFKAQGLREVEVWGGEEISKKSKTVVQTKLMGVFPLR